MRKILDFLAGKRVSPQDLSDTSQCTVERPKKPRSSKVKRTGKPISWGDLEHFVSLPCWKNEEWERRKLEVMKGKYPTPVTPDEFRQEFGGEGHWVESSFEKINQVCRELRLPYRVEFESGGFQIFHTTPRHPDRHPEE